MCESASKQACHGLHNADQEAHLRHGGHAGSGHSIAFTFAERYSPSLSRRLNHMGQLILTRPRASGGDATTPNRGNRLHFFLHIASRTELVDKGLAVRDNRWAGVLLLAAGRDWPGCCSHLPYESVTTLASSTPESIRPGLACWRLVPRGEGRPAYPRLLLLSELSRNAIAAGLACDTIPHGDAVRPLQRCGRGIAKCKPIASSSAALRWCSEKCHVLDRSASPPRTLVVWHRRTRPFQATLTMYSLRTWY